MNTFNLFLKILLLSIVATGLSHADLDHLDPSLRDKQISQVEDLYIKQDADGLLQLLKESHLFIKQEAALKLGRLGSEKSLPILREYDRRYSRFACAASGQFGVAVILIESRTADAQKRELLAVATEPWKSTQYPLSVIDSAGRELSRFEGADIISALSAVNTYGAQYTVLRQQCNKLSEPNAISKCIKILETHDTPPKAEAAQAILISYGRGALHQVQELKIRVEERITSTDPTFTITKTIRNRCDNILKQIEKSE